MPTTRPARRRLAGLGVCLGLVTGRAAAAHDHLVAFAGGQLDYARSAYAGTTLRLTSGSAVHGFAVRAVGFFGDYEYQSVHRRIAGDFQGGELDAVYRVFRRDFWLNAALGIRYVNADLSPADPNNRRHGAQGEIAASVDGGKVSGALRTDWYGSYGYRLEDYSVRFSLTHAAGSRWRAGTEISVEGDPTYSLQRGGAFAAFTLDGKSELQASAGISHQSSRDTAGYLRMSIYRSF